MLKTAPKFGFDTLSSLLQAFLKFQINLQVFFKNAIARGYFVLNTNINFFLDFVGKMTEFDCLD